MKRLKSKPTFAGVAAFMIITLFIFNTNGNAQFDVNLNEIQVIENPNDRFDFQISKSRYNRVEGLFFNLGSQYNPSPSLGVNLICEIGYGFCNEEWRYKAGIIKKFNQLNTTTISGSYFDETATLDDWVIGYWENSLAALFFKDDFKDYFNRKGFRLSLFQKFFSVHQVVIEYAAYEYASMNRKTNWSLFGGDRKFRANPSIIEGKENNLKVLAIFDWRDNPLYPINGWYFETIYERTKRDFKTQGLFLNVKRYQGTFMNQICIIQGMFGARKGSHAQQHLVDIGGVGSLRGYRDKEFSDNNRVILVHLDYRFNQDILSRLPLKWLPFYDDLSLILFSDAGWARLVDPNKGLFEGFEKSVMKAFKNDVGISVAFSEELARIDFAKRTDRANNTWRITFRLLPKF